MILEYSDKESRLHDLDLLRFIAATLVVFHHYFYQYGGGKIEWGVYSWVNEVARYGDLGVELFFAISGFVILYSAEKKKYKEFAISRLVRIYPIFWLCATLTMISFLTLGSDTREYSIAQYLANLTLLHRFIFNQQHLDWVYWTLIVEIRFYFMIGLLMFFGILKKNILIPIMIAWSAIGLTYSFIGKDGNVMLYGACFSVGVGFHYLHKEGGKLYNISFTVFSVIAMIVIAVLKGSDHEQSALVFVMLLIATALLLVSLGFETGINKKLLLLLGGATYPLYLLHQEIGFSILQYSSKESYLFLSTCVAVGMIVVSMLIYIFVEPIINHRFKSLLNNLILRNEKL